MVKEKMPKGWYEDRDSREGGRTCGKTVYRMGRPRETVLPGG